MTSLRSATWEIRVLAADHDGRRHAGSPHRGPALGFLVEGYRRWWYPGDTGPRLLLRRWRMLTWRWCQSEAGDPSIIPGHSRGHLDGGAGGTRRCVRTQPHHAVPVHWGTWWPIGLPQLPHLIDLPGICLRRPRRSPGAEPPTSTSSSMASRWTCDINAGLDSAERVSPAGFSLARDQLLVIGRSPSKMGSLADVAPALRMQPAPAGQGDLLHIASPTAVRSSRVRTR